MTSGFREPQGRPGVASGSSSVAVTLAGTVRSAAQAGSTGGVRGGCRSIPEPDPVNVVGQATCRGRHDRDADDRGQHCRRPAGRGPRRLGGVTPVRPAQRPRGASPPKRRASRCAATSARCRRPARRRSHTARALEPSELERRWADALAAFDATREVGRARHRDPRRHRRGPAPTPSRTCPTCCSKARCTRRRGTGYGSLPTGWTCRRKAPTCPRSPPSSSRPASGTRIGSSAGCSMWSDDVGQLHLPDC